MVEYFKLFSRSADDNGMEPIAALPDWANVRPPDYPPVKPEPGKEHGAMLNMAGKMIPRVQHGYSVVCRVADGQIDVWENAQD